MKNLFVSVIVAICLIGFVGCTGGKNITRSELLGTWKFTSESPENNHVAESEYTFDDSGKLSVIKNETGELGNSKVITEGTWKLSGSTLTTKRRMVQWEKEGEPVDKLPSREFEREYEVVSWSESLLNLKGTHGTSLDLSSR